MGTNGTTHTHKRKRGGGRGREREGEGEGEGESGVFHLADLKLTKEHHIQN